MSDAQDLTDLRAATVRGLRWTVIARPLVECLLLGSMVVLARLIPPAEFGHYATALVISGFGAASVSAITTALVQRPELSRAHLQAANALALGCGAALVVLTFVAAALVVAPIFGGRTADLVRLGAPGALIAAAGAVPFAVLQRRLEFRRLSVIDVAGSGYAASARGARARRDERARSCSARSWAPPRRPAWRGSGRRRRRRARTGGHRASCCITARRIGLRR